MDEPQQVAARPAKWRWVVPYLGFALLFLVLFAWQRGRSPVHRLMGHRAVAEAIAHEVGLSPAIVLAVGYQLGDELDPVQGQGVWREAASRYAARSRVASPTVAALELSGHGATVVRMRASLSDPADRATLDRALAAQPEGIAAVQLQRMVQVFEDLLSP